MGWVRSKTRSLGQILEKPCVSSRGHIFSPIIMQRSQNVCLDEILKVPIAANKKEFVYKIQVNPIHTILKYGDYHDFKDR